MEPVGLSDRGIAFGAGVHIEWATAIVWGLMIGALLAWTKSLGGVHRLPCGDHFLLGRMCYTADNGLLVDRARE